MIVKRVKYSLSVLNDLLPLLMASSFFELYFISQQIRTLRIRNERTKPRCVRSLGYNPVECLAEVMLSSTLVFVNSLGCLGFAESTTARYKSYLTDKFFIVNVGKDFSSPGKLLDGVRQRSKLGPLLFLYANDMPQAANSDIL